MGEGEARHNPLSLGPQGRRKEKGGEDPDFFVREEEEGRGRDSVAKSTHARNWESAAEPVTRGKKGKLRCGRKRKKIERGPSHRKWGREPKYHLKPRIFKRLANQKGKGATLGEAC